MKKSISLSPGQSRSVSFAISPTAVGSYDVNIGQLSRSFAVSHTVGAGVRGYITWRYTSNPVIGANVTIPGFSTQTDSDGYYEIQDPSLHTGIYTISWWHPDAKHQRHGNVYLQEGKWLDWNDWLEPK